jgi:hypothetical protein
MRKKKLKFVVQRKYFQMFSLIKIIRISELSNIMVSLIKIIMNFQMVYKLINNSKQIKNKRNLRSK